MGFHVNAGLMINWALYRDSMGTGFVLLFSVRGFVCFMRYRCGWAWIDIAVCSLGWVLEVCCLGFKGAPALWGRPRAVSAGRPPARLSASSAPSRSLQRRLALPTMSA